MPYCGWHSTEKLADKNIKWSRIKANELKELTDDWLHDPLACCQAFNHKLLDAAVFYVLKVMDTFVIDGLLSN